MVSISTRKLIHRADIAGSKLGHKLAIQEKAYKFSTQGPQEIEIPAELRGYMEEMQASLMETAAENDEILLDKYFEEGKLSKDDTKIYKPFPESR